MLFLSGSIKVVLNILVLLWSAGGEVRWRKGTLDGRTGQWSGRWATKGEGMRLTAHWSRAWRITWWGEKWIFHHYSSRLWYREKAQKGAEEEAGNTHCSFSGAVGLLWWICLASHPKKRSWLMMCSADGSVLALQQLCIWYTGVWFCFC